jgi:hypothetical protein
MAWGPAICMYLRPFFDVVKIKQYTTKIYRNTFKHLYVISIRFVNGVIYDSVH